MNRAAQIVIDPTSRHAPGLVALWIPRADEYDLARSLGLVDRPRDELDELADAVREQVARDLPGTPVRVHRARVWRLVRAMQRLGVTNTPDGRAAAAGWLADPRNMSAE